LIEQTSIPVSHYELKRDNLNVEIAVRIEESKKSEMRVA
jgi:hypothetical protein